MAETWSIKTHKVALYTLKQRQFIFKFHEKLARSHDKYSNRMLWLTGGIVFVGIVQVIIATISNA